MSADIDIAAFWGLMEYVELLVLLFFLNLVTNSFSSSCFISWSCDGTGFDISTSASCDAS